MIDYETDPYADIAEQDQAVATYGVSAVQIFWLLVPLLAAGPLINAVLRSARISIPLVVIVGLGTLILLAIQVTRVTVDASGIVIRYWLLPNRRIGWDMICQVAIRNTIAGQAAATINLCRGGKRRSVLTFFMGHLPQGGSVAPLDVLIKTVIVRAGLSDMTRSGWGNVMYSRPESEV